MTQVNNSQPKKTVTVRRIYIIAISVIVFLVINGILVAAFYKMNYLRTQVSEIISMNEPKTFNDITVKASDIKTETNYTVGAEPDANSKIISLSLTVANNSDSKFELFPSVQTFVRTNEGQTYTLTPVKTTGAFEGKAIEPGETETGRLSYRVSNKTVPMFLYVESRQASSGPFVFKLQ